MRRNKIIFLIACALVCLFFFRIVEVDMDIDSYESGHILSKYIKGKRIHKKEVTVGNVILMCDFAQKFTLEGVLGDTIHSGTFYTRDGVTMVIIQNYPVRKYFYQGRWNLY